MAATSAQLSPVFCLAPDTNGRASEVVASVLVDCPCVRMQVLLFHFRWCVWQWLPRYQIGTARLRAMVYAMSYGACDGYT